jgi:hypothetical protein
LQQVVSNIKTNCTYTNTANYWAPLIDDDDDDDGDNKEENDQKFDCDHSSMPIQTINNINDVEVQRDLKTILRKWINECTNIHTTFQRKESTMVVDSGATSSFVRPEENLPITGPSSKVVYYLMAHLSEQPTLPCCHSTRYCQKQE